MRGRTCARSPAERVTSRTSSAYARFSRAPCARASRTRWMAAGSPPIPRRSSTRRRAPSISPSRASRNGSDVGPGPEIAHGRRRPGGFAHLFADADLDRLDVLGPGGPAARPAGRRAPRPAPAARGGPPAAAGPPPRAACRSAPRHAPPAATPRWGRRRRRGPPPRAGRRRHPPPAPRPRDARHAGSARLADTTGQSSLARARPAACNAARRTSARGSARSARSSADRDAVSGPSPRTRAAPARSDALSDRGDGGQPFVGGGSAAGEEPGEGAAPHLGIGILQRPLQRGPRVRAGEDRQRAQRGRAHARHRVAGRAPRHRRQGASPSAPLRRAPAWRGAPPATGDRSGEARWPAPRDRRPFRAARARTGRRRDGPPPASPSGWPGCAHPHRRTACRPRCGRAARGAAPPRTRGRPARRARSRRRTRPASPTRTPWGRTRGRA